jgi:hypothetical protein
MHETRCWRAFAHLDAPLQRAIERLGTWSHGLSSGVDSHYDRNSMRTTKVGIGA